MGVGLRLNLINDFKVNIKLAPAINVFETTDKLSKHTNILLLGQKVFWELSYLFSVGLEYQFNFKNKNK